MSATVRVDGPSRRRAHRRLAELRRAARRARARARRRARHQPAARPLRRSVDRVPVPEHAARGRGSLFPGDPAPARLLARADRARRQPHAVRAVRHARLARGRVALARPRWLQRFLDRRRARGHRRDAVRRPPVRGARRTRRGAAARLSVARRKGGSPGTATSRPAARPTRVPPSTGGGSSMPYARTARRSAARCSPEADRAPRRARARRLHGARGAARASSGS